MGGHSGRGSVLLGKKCVLKIAADLRFSIKVSLSLLLLLLLLLLLPSLFLSLSLFFSLSLSLSPTPFFVLSLSLSLPPPSSFSLSLSLSLSPFFFFSLFLLHQHHDGRKICDHYRDVNRRVCAAATVAGPVHHIISHKAVLCPSALHSNLRSHRHSRMLQLEGGAALDDTC